MSALEAQVKYSWAETDSMKWTHSATESAKALEPDRFRDCLNKREQSCSSVVFPRFRYSRMFGIVQRTAQVEVFALLCPEAHTNSLYESIQVVSKFGTWFSVELDLLLKSIYTLPEDLGVSLPQKSISKMESLEMQQVHVWTVSCTWCISSDTGKHKNSVNSFT